MTDTIQVITVMPSFGIIHSGGTKVEVQEGWDVSPATIDLDDDTTYDFLKSVIPGCIAVMTLRDGTDMWHDDEYLYKYDTVNPIATVLAEGTQVRGPVVLARANESTGETIGLSEKEMEEMLLRITLIIDAFKELEMSFTN